MSSSLQRNRTSSGGFFSFQGPGAPGVRLHAAIAAARLAGPGRATVQPRLARPRP